MSVHEARLGDAPTAPDPRERVTDEPRPRRLTPNPSAELAALQGVVKFPVRIKCATLSWNTLAQGLDEAESRSCPGLNGDAGSAGCGVERPLTRHRGGG